MPTQASTAIPSRTARRAKARQRTAPAAKTGDFVAVVLFALAGLCLSVGAPLLSPDVLNTDDPGTILSP